MNEVRMLKGTEMLATLNYTRDNDGQIKTITSKGLPGEEKPSYTYDENNRLTKAGTIPYEYDPANNPTKEGSSLNTFNADDQLEKTSNATYAYNEVGQRTKMTPTSGPATTYAYNQAGNLTSVNRPEEGSTPKIEDTYTYNGDGLRASQTINGKTSYLTWDTSSSGLPLLLNDQTNNYIYGPEGIPFEQIDSEGKILYLHHDQAGSTRMLTGTTGTIEATFTYDAYGNQTGHTGTATTAMGYDGQYMNSDTGLIYLRARSYDPTTAQFVSVDPATETTHAPYTYALDNPLSNGDPTGLTPWSPKVKQAVARCRTWKAWHSKKSPYYGNRNIYSACQDLLRLPPEVYGTGPSGKGVGTVTSVVKAGEVCVIAGVNVALVTRATPVSSAAGGVVTVGCFGYAVGEQIVDPILHDVLPGVFAE